MISANKARKKMKYAPAWIIVLLSLSMIACWALVAIAAGGMLLVGCSTGNPAQEADNPAAETQPAGPATESTETPAPTSTPSPTPTKTPPQCGSYCAAWAGGEGFYNRDLAVKFAIDNKVDYEEWRHIVPHPDNDCTNFVSYALRDGGLLTNNTWKPGELAWVNAPELFNYLKDNAGFTENSEVFINTQDGRTSFNKDYLQLRENNKNTATDPIHGNQVLNHWDSFIAQNQNIKPGDLVFLLDPNEYDGAWSHVEIVTGWGDETTWDSQITNGIMEPLVVDHSGRIEDPAKLPRSVGDTAGVGIQKVVFLRGP
jgi:hypothetical protein